MFQLIVYQQDRGQCPFDKWFEGLRDQKAHSRIIQRLSQVEAGNLGDCKSVGEGVIELRIDVGPGYRIYCARHGEALVILLSGEDKASQSQDIERAKEFWADWKRRHR